MGSGCWLSKFKARFVLEHGLQYGEAKDVNVEEWNEWKATELQSDLARYHPNDVFNGDETSIFWKAFPCRGVF